LAREFEVQDCRTDAEIRRPTILKDRIIPYEKPDNLEFEVIMDCVNPAFFEKGTGGIFHADRLCEKNARNASPGDRRSTEGMDYVIIDRCAGVGNLEEGLPDDILSHCILSTIEPNEYQILRWKYAGKSAVVIPIGMPLPMT
jgi:hypothetical protein